MTKIPGTCKSREVKFCNGCCQPRRRITLCFLTKKFAAGNNCVFALLSGVSSITYQTEHKAKAFMLFVCSDCLVGVYPWIFITIVEMYAHIPNRSLDIYPLSRFPTTMSNEFTIDFFWLNTSWISWYSSKCSTVVATVRGKEVKSNKTNNKAR